MRIAAGKFAGTSVSVAALVQGVLRTMLFARWKSLVLLLVVSVPVLLAATLSRSEGPQERETQNASKSAATRNVGGGTNEEEKFTETLRKSEFLGILTQQSSLQPVSDIKLFSSISGTLKSLSVDVGDNVKAGQVLAEIDAPLLVVDVEEAEAVVDREKARIELATTRLGHAKADLSPRPSRPKADLEAMIGAATQEAQAELSMARAELTVAMARLHRAKAHVKLARLVSPIDGVITRRCLQPGEIVRGLDEPATVILEIADISRLKAMAYVKVQDLGSIEKGSAIKLSPRTATNEVYVGRVSQIDVKEQPQFSTIEIVALIENPKRQLRPGQGVVIRLELTKQSGILTIPISALMSRQGEEIDQHGTCYRFVKGSAIPTEVKLGSLGDQGRRVQVLSGLNEGDRVITQPRLVKHVRKVDP